MAEPTDMGAGARRKGPPRKVVVAALVAAVAMAYLVIWGVRGAAVYSLTIPELKAKGSAAIGQGVRVSGVLDGDTVSWQAQSLRLSFELESEGESLPVVYNGAKPDMLRDEAEVIVEGKLSADGTFHAQKLMLVCPSKYESEAPAGGT